MNPVEARMTTSDFHAEARMMTSDFHVVARTTFHLLDVIKKIFHSLDKPRNSLNHDNKVAALILQSIAWRILTSATNLIMRQRCELNAPVLASFAAKKTILTSAAMDETFAVM
jgi:hypothetical protein